MSRSLRKSVDVYYGSDKSRNKVGKEITIRTARSVRKRELKKAIKNDDTDLVFSMQNNRYVYGWMVEKGCILPESELKKDIEIDMVKYPEDYEGVNKKRKSLNFRMRK